jgi:hypothetical protein
MANNEKTEIADILLVRGKYLCHDCFNQLPPKQRGGRAARPWAWTAENKPNACCSKCGREGYYVDEDEQDIY